MLLIKKFNCWFKNKYKRLLAKNTKIELALSKAQERFFNIDLIRAIKNHIVAIRSGKIKFNFSVFAGLVFLEVAKKTAEKAADKTTTPTAPKKPKTKTWGEWWTAVKAEARVRWYHAWGRTPPQPRPKKEPWVKPKPLYREMPDSEIEKFHWWDWIYVVKRKKKLNYRKEWDWYMLIEDFKANRTVEVMRPLKKYLKRPIAEFSKFFHEKLLNPDIMLKPRVSKYYERSQWFKEVFKFFKEQHIFFIQIFFIAGFIIFFLFLISCWLSYKKPGREAAKAMALAPFATVIRTLIVVLGPINYKRDSWIFKAEGLRRVTDHASFGSFIISFYYIAWFLFFYVTFWYCWNHFSDHFVDALELMTHHMISPFDLALRIPTHRYLSGIIFWNFYKNYMIFMVVKEIVYKYGKAEFVEPELEGTDKAVFRLEHDGIFQFEEDVGWQHVMCTLGVVMYFAGSFDSTFYVMAMAWFSFKPLWAWCLLFTVSFCLPLFYFWKTLRLFQKEVMVPYKKYIEAIDKDDFERISATWRVLWGMEFCIVFWSMAFGFSIICMFLHCVVLSRVVSLIFKYQQQFSIVIKREQVRLPEEIGVVEVNHFGKSTESAVEVFNEHYLLMLNDAFWSRYTRSVYFELEVRDMVWNSGAFWVGYIEHKYVQMNKNVDLEGILQNLGDEIEYDSSGLPKNKITGEYESLFGTDLFLQSEWLERQLLLETDLYVDPGLN